MGSNPTPCTITEHPKSSEGFKVLGEYVSYLLAKKSLKHSTIKRKVKALRSLLKRGINLNDADEVITFLNTCDLASGTKQIILYAYEDYLKMKGIELKLPKIRREYPLPFIPLEKELDQLISRARMKMKAFLQLLKETGARPLEAWSLKWNDIDIPNRAITIKAVKYSRSRKLRISNELLNMLLALPKKHDYVFSTSGKRENFEKELQHFTRNYLFMRNKLAEELKNPRIRRISLRTFRHWKATMEYLRTRDIVHVKELLGHVNIQNTLKYIHLANAISNNESRFICKTAKTVEEAKALIEQGFEYVTEIDGIKLFRKPK